MKAIKVNQPAYLNVIGPQIADFQRMLDLPRVTYESMWEYFRMSIQFGGERDEFWIVMDDEGKPVAFAHWFVYMSLHVGSIHCDFLYRWGTKDETPIALLINEFIEFGRKNHSNHITATFVKEATFRVFRKHLAKKGYDLKKDNTIIASALPITKPIVKEEKE